MYRYIENSKKYKYVCKYQDPKGRIFWQGKRYSNGKMVESERKAAINVDIQLLNHGKQPINVLKRR
ncbi:MAG: hypothetical protein ACOCVF_01200 [bacterium]